LRAIDLCVAVELSDYFNEDDNGGRAWPGLRTLGDPIGLHEVSVLRAMRRLEVGGHLRVVPGRPGRGQTNQYWMAIKPAAGQVLDAAKPAAGQVSDKNKPANQSGKPANQSKKPAGRQQNHSKNHSKNHSRDIDSPPAGDFFKKESGEENNKKNTDATTGAARFGEFWTAYPKKVGKLDAERAFAKALQRAGADELIAGARRYAGERSGQDQKFTKHPATWLNKGCWGDEPSATGPPIIDGITGEPVEAPRRRNRDEWDDEFEDYKARHQARGEQ
jgi:hypothetical protein